MMPSSKSLAASASHTAYLLVCTCLCGSREAETLFRTCLPAWWAGTQAGRCVVKQDCSFLWVTGATRKPSHKKIGEVDGRAASQDSCKVHLDKVRTGISDSHPKSRILHQRGTRSVRAATTLTSTVCVRTRFWQSSQGNPPRPIQVQASSKIRVSPTLRLNRA